MTLLGTYMREEAFRDHEQAMSAKEKMLSAAHAVRDANIAIKREMGKVTLADRMNLLSDADSRQDLRDAIKGLEATLKELKKF